MSGSPPGQPSPDDVRIALQETLSQVKGAAPRRPPELAEACANALARLKPDSAGQTAGLAPEAFLQVLKIACELEGSPAVTCAALMSFERLMTMGYFVGPSGEAQPTEPGAAPRLLMDNVMDVICNCSEQARDDVQLRLVGAISLAVTSPVCEVHGKSLIRAVSTCFKVYKNSANPSNQQTAKEALTRIAHLLMQLSLAASQAAGNGSTPAVPKGDGDEGYVMVPKHASAEQNSDQVEPEKVVVGTADQVVATSAGTGARQTSEGEETGAPKVLSLQLRDALQVLLSFSKQSLKEPLPGQLERQFLRSKRISLEMVFAMLDAADQAFMSGEHCVRILTQTLCLALIKNSVSSLPDVFELSLNVFLVLVSKCRQHVKREIGVFITTLLLQLLSSGNSTYQLKQAALHTILRMCTDASIAIELFLNFDCHLESDNVFGIIVERLSQIAQGKYQNSEHSSLIDPQQEAELKVLALKTLVKLSGALADWAYRAPAGAPDAPDGLPVIMERRNRKRTLKRAVEKFNTKPKKGYVDLKESGFITDEAASLADLIRKENTGLDKTVVGDYLGENKPFNESVLQALIDAQNFKGLGVDGALRLLLSSFRLPGEAQKIDRIIDGFSKKFCEDNPGVFANSDTAHILAFSVMMLQTDLHSDQIKNKMTKAAFVSNNRGIDDGKNLPQEYLEGLFDAVAATPFSLKEDDDARIRLASQQAQTVAQKMQLFVKESEEIVQTAMSKLLPIPVKSDTPYVTARIAEHACPTFGAACWPLLAAFTTVLQDVDEQTEPGIMELCVEGLRLCVRVAARFDMHTKRDATVSALAMFTYLMTLKEIKQKNVECIKALLSIALTDGSGLGGSWQHVLQCLSRLEQLQLISAKAQPDFQYFQAGGASASSKQAAPARNLSAAGITTLLSTGNDDQVEQMNSLSVMSQVDSALIDRLFHSSAKLDGSAIVSFVVQLVRVSRDELEIDSKPRVFSLHKLVEVGDYNMSRPSAVWGQIWEPLSQHLVEVAQRPNKDVSMYAVDSLRQLSTRFLDKEEDSSAELRMAVLKPFEVLVSSTRMSEESKSFVVDAVLNIAQSRSDRIKAGWKMVLRILEAVSWAIKNQEVIQRGFTAINSGMKTLLEEHFQETMETTRAFAKCQASVATSLEAIKCLHQAAHFVCASEGGPEPTVAQQGFSNILKYLADSVWDQRKDVRTAALETLFEILCEHPSFLDGPGWTSVLADIIEPLFKGLHDQLSTEGVAPVYLAALKAFGCSVRHLPPAVLTRTLVPLERAVRQEGEAAPNAAVADAARGCISTVVTRGTKHEGMDPASISILEAAAKEFLQNGGSGDASHP